MRITLQDSLARDRDRLGEILIAANVRQNKTLHQYLETWLAVRPDITAWRRSNPNLATLLDTTLAGVRWTPIFQARALEITAHMKGAEEYAGRLLKQGSEDYKRYCEDSDDGDTALPLLRNASPSVSSVRKSP
jgi:hypothetical protein